jgi:hypothetical protein
MFFLGDMNANFWFFLWNCLLMLVEVWSTFAKNFTMKMKHLLNPKQMCKGKTKQEKGKVPKHIQNFRSLTRELNPPSKRGLPTAVSMSCTNKQH